MKRIITVLALAVGLFMTPLAFAQAPAAVNATINTPVGQVQANPNEITLHIKQDPAPAPVAVAPAPKPAEPEKSVAQKANEWVEVGKNIGSAMDAGLNSLTKHADEFSKTDAGRFTMFIIGWKVAGKEAVELTRYAVKLLVGFPCLAIVFGLYVWIVRRWFLCNRRVLIKKEGWFFNKTKEYKLIEDSPSEREAKHIGLLLSTLGLVLIGWLIIANVIL